MTDGAGAGPGRGDTAIGSTVRALREATAAALLAAGWLQRWVRRRGRLTQLFLGGIAAVLVESSLDATVSILTAVSFDAFVLSPGQLLTVLVGGITVQTVLQIRKLFHIDGRLETMDRATALPDGGEEVGRRGEEIRRTFDGDTTGGGAIGGAIAGAGVGASYGVSGLVFGAVVGWIVGDEFEQRVLIPSE